MARKAKVVAPVVESEVAEVVAPEVVAPEVVARKAKARKAKAVAPEVVAEVVEVVAPEVGQVVVEAGSVEAQKIHEVVVKQLEEALESNPSPLLSMALAQITNGANDVAVAVPAVKSDKNEGVGLFIRKLISEGLSNKAILEIVHEQYGNKNTTYACVAWYRNKMKKAGAVQAKSSALDFINNFAKSNGLSEEAVEVLKSEFKVA